MGRLAQEQDLTSIRDALSVPPPRPLAPIARGSAFVLAVTAVAGSVVGLGAFLLLLTFRILPYIRSPILGDTAATVSVLGCLASAALFVVCWVLAASALRSLLMYRTGIHATGIVDRIALKSENQATSATIHWHFASSASQSHSLRSTVRLPRVENGIETLEPGKAVHVLYPTNRPGSAYLVGLLGLRRDWHLAPEIQPPKGFSAFRLGTLVVAAVVAAVAITGLTVNRTLDPGYLKQWTWVVVLVGAVLSTPFALALRRWGPWLPGEWWAWLMATFLVMCLGSMGAMSGANVWFDRSEPQWVETEILHMDEEFFPGWHRAAFVRSWREGQTKERIPLYWRMGLDVLPGDDLHVEIHDGAFGWPTVGEVSRVRRPQARHER